MKKLIATSVLCLGLMLSAPVSTVAADSDGGSSWSTSTSWSWSGLQTWWSSFKQRVLSHFSSSSSTGTKAQPTPSGSSVPELDMTAAGSAVVLLLGGVAYIASRRREQE